MESRNSISGPIQLYRGNYIAASAESEVSKHFLLESSLSSDYFFFDYIYALLIERTS